MTDLYMSAGPDPSGDPDNTYITANQIGVGRLRRAESEGEQIKDGWLLSSVSPASFEPVAFEADDKDEAIRQAKGWLVNHIQENPDLYEGLFD